MCGDSAYLSINASSRCRGSQSLAHASLSMPSELLIHIPAARTLSLMAVALTLPSMHRSCGPDAL